MQSAAQRSFTVVTVMTLIFTPVLKGHRWIDMLTGKTENTIIVDCMPSDPCPARHHLTEKVVLPGQA